MNRLQFFENIRGAMLVLLLLVGVALVPAGAFATAGATLADPDDLKVATGVVVDKKTGEPLISVNVAVWANGRLVTGTSTDFDGKFKIISPVIDFELRVSYVGYNEAKFSSKNGALHDLRVELSEESSTLTEVVVRGWRDRTEALSKENNGDTIQKIIRDRLKKTLAFTEDVIALLSVGTYYYALDWYQNGAFLCNIIPASTLKVVDKA